MISWSSSTKASSKIPNKALVSGFLMSFGSYALKHKSQMYPGRSCDKQEKIKWKQNGHLINF